MIEIHHHKYSLIIVYAIVLHLIWGFLGIADISAYDATAFSAIHYVFGGMSPFICFFVAIAALIGLNKKGLLGLQLMLPQQALLMLSAFGATMAIVNGHFADGVIRSAFFIAADQTSVILTAIFHTMAIVHKALEK